MHNFRKLPTLLAAVILAALAGQAQAQLTTVTTVVDFETEPALTTQPGAFFAAGPMQTYSRPGLYTLSGGVVLGNPSLLPAFAASGTAPNLYGTTDIADPTLLPILTLEFPVSAGVFAVEGTLFNGQPIPEDYVVSAFSGLTPVGSQFFSALPENFNAGFGLFSLSTAIAPFTRVTITTPNAAANGWDFFVDTVRVTQVIPEPSTLGLTGPGLCLLAACRLRRRRGESPAKRA